MIVKTTKWKKIKYNKYIDYDGDKTDIMSLNGDTEPGECDDILDSDEAGLGWFDPMLPDEDFLFLSTL